MIGSSDTWIDTTVEESRRPSRTALASAALVAAVLLVFYGLPIMSTFDLMLLTDAVPAAYLTAGAIRFLGCVPNLN